MAEVAALEGLIVVIASILVDIRCAVTIVRLLVTESISVIMVIDTVLVDVSSVVTVAMMTMSMIIMAVSPMDIVLMSQAMMVQTVVVLSMTLVVEIDAMDTVVILTMMVVAVALMVIERESVMAEVFFMMSKLLMTVTLMNKVSTMVSLRMMTLEAIAARFLIATMQSMTAASVSASLRSSKSMSMTIVAETMTSESAMIFSLAIASDISRMASLVMGFRTMITFYRSTIASVMTEALIIKIKLLVSATTAIASSVMWVAVSSMRSDTESIVTVISTMTIFLAEFSVVMRSIFVAISIAIFIVSGSPWAIRIIVMIAQASVVVNEARSVETSVIVIQVKFLVSTTTVTSSMVWVTVVTVGTDAESVVTIISSVIVLFTELSVVMRAVLVSIGVAVLVVGRSPWTIRIVVVVMTTIASWELDELVSA